MGLDAGATIVWGVELSVEWIHLFHETQDIHKLLGQAADAQSSISSFGYGADEQELEITIGPLTFTHQKVPAELGRRLSDLYEPDRTAFYRERLSNVYPKSTSPTTPEKWHEWFPPFVEFHGLDAVCYSNNIVSGGEYGGVIIGKRIGTFRGPVPERLDRRCMSIGNEYRRKLRTFLRKFSFEAAKPGYFIRVFGSA